jgi:phosphatidate phosphatase APP1
MVGDSGERDPEIYGHLARQFPRQVRRILIRRVHGRSLSVDRLHRAFRDVPRDKWQTFQCPSELGGLSELT